MVLRGTLVIFLPMREANSSTNAQTSSGMSSSLSRILYMECWDSEEELHRHIRSDMYRRVLEAMELSRVSPEVQFHRVTEAKGMDLIGALRGEAQGPERG